MIYEPESNSIEADVLNAPEVTVATSMGFSMRRSIMANRLAYTFEEPLEAGTQITVSEGPVFAEVFTPSTFEYVGFNRSTGVVTAIAKGPANSGRITTSYGVDETVMLGWDGTHKTFEFTLPNVPEGAFEFVLYIDQSHYTYTAEAAPAGELTSIQYNAITNQVWVTATGTDEAEATTSTGITATLNLSTGGTFFNIGQTPLAPGATITVTSIDDELTYTVPQPEAFEDFEIVGNLVSVGNARSEVGFFLNDMFIISKEPDETGHVEHLYSNASSEGLKITVKSIDATQVTNFVVPADPNKDAMYTTRMTLKADGQQGHRQNVQPGDTAYLVITPTGLVTNKQVRLDLNLQNSAATLAGPSTVTLVPGQETVVAINVVEATAPYAFVGVSVVDPVTSAYLATSRPMNIPEVEVVPTAITVSPTAGHADVNGIVINYTFDQTPYSAKSVSAVCSNPGVTATDFSPATDEIEDGNIYLKFDEAQIADLEVLEIDITIDGLTATSSITFHKAGAET